MKKRGNFVSVSVFMILAAFSSVIHSVSGQGVDEPAIFGQRLFILQNYVENFNNGLNAGGELIGFGNVLEQFTIQDGEGNTLKAHPVSGIDAAGHVATVATGFGTGTGEDFIGFSKTFTTSTNPDTGETSNTIDASNFNAISYFVKNDSDNSASSAGVSLQLVIGDGGDITPNDNTDTFTGSTWEQTDAKPLSGIVGNPDNNNFERIVLGLQGTVAGVTGGFKRTIGPTDGATHSELTSDLLAQVSAVNIVVNSGGESGTPRSIFVDDINFFDNFILNVTQDRVFSKADGTTVVTVTATLTQTGGTPVPEVEVCFIVNEGINHPKTACIETDTLGVAVFEFVVTSETSVFTVDVGARP